MAWQRADFRKSNGLDQHGWDGWEPAKYVARLRTLKTNATPLLFHISMDAGHGGASGRYDYLKEIAFDYAFLLTQLAIVK